MQEFIKVFEIGEHQVAAICRGAADAPDRWKFEQATYIDGVLFNAIVELPFPHYEKVLDLYSDDRAAAFLDIALGMMADTDHDGQDAAQSRRDQA